VERTFSLRSFVTDGRGGLIAVVHLEHAHIKQGLTRVVLENLGNIFGHSLICREESEGHDFFVEHAGYVDASVHDPVDTPYGHQFGVFAKASLRVSNGPAPP
jgi:hypothetical protein